MKKILLVVATIMASVNGSAQNSSTNGYRGFVDVAYSKGIRDYEFGRVEINTSHGYQFNPYFYLGVGVGFHFMSEYKTNGKEIPLDVRNSDVRNSKVDIPIFANARANFSKSKITPFVDIKAGAFVTNSGGLYLNPSAGVRIALNEKQAIDFSIGYSYENLQFQTFSNFISNYNLDYSRKDKNDNAEAVTIKVGFEF